MSSIQNPLKSNTLIIICGPTAVGKTNIAIQVANHFNTEIINADSRQVYNELNIGVAKPSAGELASVNHHLIGTQSVSELYGAGDFEKEALRIVADLFKTHNPLIMCGGTGMYIKAFCEGLDDLPKADELYRAELKEKFDKNGVRFLQDELGKADANAKTLMDFENPQRLMRALEIMKVSGKKYSEVLAGKKVNRPFNIIKIGINIERNLLYDAINKRVDTMMQMGLLDEVKQLKKFENLNALKTVGYNELFDYLNGNSTLPFAIEKIKQHTRNYAKRQLTWFRADKEITWFESSQTDELIRFVESKLS
jgi:tRNA dimethylallyltransferase